MISTVLSIVLQVIIALNHTLVLHEKIRRGEAELTYSTKELIYHYNCGDLREVLFAKDLANLGSLRNSSHFNDRYEVEQARKLDEYLKEELLYKRNQRMAKRVLKLIEEAPKKKFFFAFGAGHFLGNGSVIDILKNQGFNITHIQANETLPRYGNPRTAKKPKKVMWARKPSRKKSRKRLRSRKNRKNRKQRRRIWRVDNLWQRIHAWSPNPPVLTQAFTNRNIPTTTRLSSPSSIDDIKENNSSGIFCASSMLLWICLFLILM